MTQGFALDMTLNLANVLTVLGFSAVTLVSAVKLRDSIRDTTNQVVNLKEDFKEVRTSVSNLQASLSEVATLQARLADGKERMDSLEERIHTVERENSRLQGIVDRRTVAS